MRKLTIEKFKEKAKEIHGERYDYSLVEYKTNKTKIQIKCNDCKTSFIQSPNAHLLGNGCPECGGTKKLTQEEFLERVKEIHGNRYDYSLVEYINRTTKIKIICSEHGIFEQSPNVHLNNHGCPDCYGNKKSTTEEWIQKVKEIHGDLYDYSLVEYKNNSTKIKIICKNCEEIFEPRPNDHLTKASGCPNCCCNNVSKKEVQWLDYLGIPQQYRHQTVTINNKKYNVDAFIPYFGEPIIYEYSGNYWHGNPERFNPDDINKRNRNKKLYKELYHETIERLNLFRENGYKVVYIWESEWDNLLKFNKEFNIL